jgi:glycosyltransferase involved in cell wall biosynthesis
MKVLRLIGGLDASHGGPPVSSLRSCIAARRAGAATTLAFPAVPAPDEATRSLMARLRDEGVETIVFPAARGRRESWGASLPFARWIHRNRGHFDLVHCHGAWQMATMVAILPPARRRPPVVLTPNESLTDFDLAQTPDPRTRLIKPRLRRYYARRIGLYIMASALEARDSRSGGPAATGRAAIIPHAVWDDRAPLPSPRDALGIESPLRLGYIGRLHGKKNVDMLLRALSGLPERVSLTIAGSGPDEDRLRRLSMEIGVAGRVDWLGFVSGAAKDGFFRRIDLLAMPSAYECFGMAAAEALAAGVPVVLSENTGIAEIVRREGGGIVVRADQDALRLALKDLIAAPDRLATLSRQAIGATEAALSLSAHGVALYREYEKLLDHG